MPDRISSPFGTIQLSPGKHDSLLERMFGETAPEGPSRNPRVPPIDVIETSSGFVIHVDLPGIDKDDIEVKCNGRLISISAEAKADTSTEGAWIVHERRVGRFVRGIDLGVEVDPRSVTASCNDGVLTLQVSKPSGTEAESVSIKIG